MTEANPQTTPTPCEIDDALLEILACPVPACRAALRREAAVLVCTGCGLRYPCSGRWPTLIPEEALSADETAGNE